MTDPRPWYYRLDGHTPVVAGRDDLARQYKDPEARRVAQTKVGDASVSTVFLAIDHGWGNEPPILFETMIFGGDYDEWQWRYGTWEQAEAGHNRVVDALERGEAPAQ